MPSSRVRRYATRHLPYRAVRGFRTCRDLAECEAALAQGASSYFQEPAVDRWRRDGTLRRVAELVPDEPVRTADSPAPDCEPYTAVHVRRGDYVTFRFAAERLGVCTADYFTAAIRGLAPTPQTILVSDDPGWCEQVLVPRFPSGTRVAREGSDMSDFALLRRATQVVANSTFSWWAAVLGQATTVVAPAPWFNVPGPGRADLSQSHWVHRDKTTGALVG